MSKLNRLVKNKRVRSYVIVGILSFLFEYGLFSLIYYITSNIIIAQTLSYGISLIANFFGNQKVTFRAKNGFDKSISRQLIAFGVLALCNLILTNILIYLLHSVGIIPAIAKLIVMASVVLWNFLIFQKFIFKPKK